MRCDIVNHVKWFHFPFCKLKMRLCNVSSPEVSFDVAFMVERNEALVIIKAPVGKMRRNDDGLIEEPALEAQFVALPNDRVAQFLFLSFSAPFSPRLPGHHSAMVGFLTACRTRIQKRGLWFRIRFFTKSDRSPHAAAHALAFILSGQVAPPLVYAVSLSHNTLPTVNLGHRHHDTPYGREKPYTRIIRCFACLCVGE